MMPSPCRVFFLIVLHVVFIFSSFGQSANNVFGVVADSDENPVPYASVVLYQTKDSSIAGGAATDEEGRFSIQVSPGNYYLKVSFLSYEEKTVPNIQLENSELDLGKIILQPGEVSIDEVEVTSEKSSMQLQLDKRVFNVGKDLSNTGNNALEILENVPSVAVDIDGNVSLRGSQNVRVLIDGKPSSLTGISSTEALRLLQGNLIESVEVITNPSARYDAEGEVGILNIVMKKEKQKGVNGSFDVTAGYPHNYNGAYNINYRRKWVNLFSSFSIHYRKTPGKGHTLQRYESPDTSYTYESNREHNRGGLGTTVKLGSDFYLNDFNTLTASGLFSYSKGDNKATTEYNDKDQNGKTIQTVERIDNEEETQQNWEAALYYQKSFKKKKEQKFSIDFQWSSSDDTEISNITEENLSNGSDIIFQRTSNTEDEQNWLAQADYIHPFKKNGKFETGAKANWRFIQNNYKVEQLSNLGDWEVLPEFNDDFQYGENIYAAYAMVGDKIKNFSWQGGMRVEYSDISTELLESGTVNDRQYFDWFPSAHLSYEFRKKQTLQLSFSKRLSRPRFRWLLPFSGYSDARNYWSGNPDLDPEYTNSVELGYLKYWEKGSLLSSVYYRYRTGVIERITLADTAGFTTRFPINLSTQHAYGLEFNGNYDVLNWWRLTASFNFYRAISEGEYESQRLSSDTYSWSIRASSKMTIAKRLDFQLAFDYQGPEETTQGKNKSSYSLDAGFSIDVLKGNGTITLSGKDILNSRKRRNITQTDVLYTESEFQWRSWQVLLNFNYRLNQKKKRDTRSGGFDEGGEF